MNIIVVIIVTICMFSSNAYVIYICCYYEYKSEYILPSIMVVIYYCLCYFNVPHDNSVLVLWPVFGNRLAPTGNSQLFKITALLHLSNYCCFICLWYIGSARPRACNKTPATSITLPLGFFSLLSVEHLKSSFPKRGKRHSRKWACDVNAKFKGCVLVKNFSQIFRRA